MMLLLHYNKFLPRLVFLFFEHVGLQTTYIQKKLVFNNHCIQHRNNQVGTRPNRL